MDLCIYCSIAKARQKNLIKFTDVKSQIKGGLKYYKSHYIHEFVNLLNKSLSVGIYTGAHPMEDRGVVVVSVQDIKSTMCTISFRVHQCQNHFAKQ